MGEYVRKKINGISMWLNPNDHGISKRLLLLNGQREPGYQWILQKEAKGVAVDVGANIGWYTVLLSLCCKKVYAYEPDPRNWKLLKKNTIDKDNVEIKNEAISDKNGFLNIYLAKRPNLTTVLGDGESYRVPCRTLKEHMPGTNFIKMDVEGAEVSVMNGVFDKVCDMTPEDRPSFLVEVHPKQYSSDNDFSAILRKYINIGYFFKYVVNAKGKMGKFDKYTRRKTFKHYGERAVFKDVPANVVIPWATEMPDDGKKVIRSIYLCNFFS